MRVLLAFVAVVLVDLLASQACRGQELQRLREEVRSVSADQPFGDESNRRRRRCDDDDENFVESFLGWAFWQALTSPYRLPRVMVDDVDFSPGFFVRSPYCEYVEAGTSNVVSYPGLITHGAIGDDGDSAWIFRTRFDYAEDFDALSKIGGQLLIDSSIRFGIETEFNYFREDFRFRVDDELWMGDANVVYRFTQSERLQLRSGLGLNWLSDREDTDLGFNFTYGGDWFPCRPWVMSIEIDAGSLGNESLFHGRVTGGIVWHNTEVYVGYDHLSVGDADLDLMVTGLRFWL